MSSAELALARVDCQGTNGFDQIINRSLPAVRYLASRLALRLPPHIDMEDLIQVGILGLLQSANRFDSQRGVKFQTYANRRVEGAMLDYLRSMDWRPRSVRKRNRQLAKAWNTVTQRLGENATEEDLAAEVGVSSSKLQQWKQEATLFGVPAYATSKDGEESEKAGELMNTLVDPSDTPESSLQNDELREMVAKAIDRLPSNERIVLTLYYYEHLTMKQIGDLLAVKQARVSQLHGQAIGRLRNRFQDMQRSRTSQKRAAEWRNSSTVQ